MPPRMRSGCAQALIELDRAVPLMATMDERRQTDDGLAVDAQQLASLLGEGRRRTKDLLNESRSLVQSLQAKLGAHLNLAAAELAEKHSQVQSGQESLAVRARDLEAEGARLQELERHLADREASLSQAQQQLTASYQSISEGLDERLKQLDGRLEQLGEEKTAVRQDQQSLRMAEEEVAAERVHLAALRQKLDERLEALDAEREDLASGRRETESQRRRVARKFQAARASQQTKLARQRSELERLASGDSTGLQLQLTQALTESEKLRNQEANARKMLSVRAEELGQLQAEHAQSVSELEHARRQLATREAQWQSEREELALADQELRGQEANLRKLLAARAEEVGHLQAEYAQNVAALEHLRRQLEARETEWQAERNALARIGHSAETLERQREALAETQRQLEEAQARFLEERRVLSADRDGLAIAQEELARARQRLEIRQRDLDEERHELDQKERGAESFERQQNLLAEAQRGLEEAQARVLEERRALSDERNDLTIAQEELARTRQRLEHQTRMLDEERQELESSRHETENQRQRIAERLRAQRTQQLEELARREADFDRRASAGEGSVQEELLAANTESAELRQQAAQLRKLLNARAEELTQLRKESSVLTLEVEELRSAHDTLSQALAVKQSTSGDESLELRQLKTERDDLTRRLAKADARLAEAGSEEGQSEKVDELRRRFEMAIEDVRDLKRRNADLEAKASQGRSGGVATDSGGGRMDWESQKRRLLASLEADFDEDDRQDDEARLTIEGTIRITDEVVAQKEQEITQLRRQLESTAASKTTESTAAAAIIDTDELVQAERARLQQIQEEWREKLRQAEIDLSIERAKVARDRAENEERLRAIELQQAECGSLEDVHSGAPRSSKPPRGRWLTRLGLKDLEE